MGWGTALVAACGAAAALTPAVRLAWADSPARAEPAAIVVRAPGRRQVAVMRVRFYADDNYRGSGAARWQDRVRVQLGALNGVLEPSLGVRLEAESFRRWPRKSPNGQLGAMLDELRAADPGAGVDWVIGLCTALPLVTSSIHDLGMAAVLGRHFVLRAMSSVEEYNALAASFPELAKDQRDRLEALYSRRKQHKELVVFLHEWAHTLGAPHAEGDGMIMAPKYTHRSSAFARLEGELLANALDDRLASRGRATIDWSGVAAFVAGSRDAWSPSAQKELAVALAGPAAGAAVGPDQTAIPDRAAPVPDRAAAAVAERPRPAAAPEADAARAFLAASLAGATEVGGRCAGHARGLPEAYVRLVLADEGGPPRQVVVLEPGAPAALGACLVRELKALALPRPPPDFDRRHVVPVSFRRRPPRFLVLP